MRDTRMSVDLEGETFRLKGAGGPITDALADALSANGAQPAAGAADVLIAVYPLLPDSELDLISLTADAKSMAERGGRIVVVMSAMAVVPMRRHIDYSAAMAAAYAQIRGLAMQFGPGLLVNAVGCGLIESRDGHLLSGVPAMLTHVPLGHAGSIDDICGAVLFLCDPLNSYTTGQILMVDGGWSPGYGRNF